MEEAKGRMLLLRVLLRGLSEEQHAACGIDVVCGQNITQLKAELPIKHTRGAIKKIHDYGN